jgi:hypothetical protein
MELHALKRTSMFAVIPANAGIQKVARSATVFKSFILTMLRIVFFSGLLDPDVRRDDDGSHVS